jgi:outer membrane protein assembly factor BamB
VYVGSSTSLAAHAADTGTQLWSTPVEGGTTSPPVLANGVVYVGTPSSVVALDALTGELLWTGPTDGPVQVPPAVVNGFVYAGTAPLFSGSLYAFGLPG